MKKDIISLQIQLEEELKFYRKKRKEFGLKIKKVEKTLNFINKN